MVTRQEFIEYSQTFYGVRWRHEGRSTRGIDCAGLVIVAGRDLGLLPTDFDVMGYVRQSTTFDFAGYFDKNMTKKSFSQRRSGDVLLFRDNLNPCHCGILWDRPHRGETIIHSDARRRKVTYDPLKGELTWRAYSYCYEFDFED